MDRFIPLARRPRKWDRRRGGGAGCREGTRSDLRSDGSNKRNKPLPFHPMISNPIGTLGTQTRTKLWPSLLWVSPPVSSMLGS